MFDAVGFLVYIFITAITPGPNNIMSMTNASRQGFRRSFPFNLGIYVGFLIVMTLCMVFSSLLQSLIPQIAIGMKIVGAAYMLYLAWKTFHSAMNLDTEAARSGFVAGLLLQFVNPKIYIYAITAMGSYILPYFSGFWALAGFVVALATMGFVGTIAWALFGSAFKRLFATHGKIINIVMALLLVYCAVSLFL